MDVCKLHGLGNDFLVVQVGPSGLYSINYAPIVVAMCDRHYGIGADGLMVVEDLSKGASALFGTRIFNQDGSEAEMSGNGIRCAATYLLHYAGVHARCIEFETKAGRRKARFLEKRECVYFFETFMGQPIFSSTEIPMIISEVIQPIVDYPVPVNGRMVEVTVLSLGNPHCVVFSDSWGDFDRDYLGFNLSNHPLFPNRVNVEFVQVIGRHEIRVHFWERGVGSTLSSGSGSCAAAVASVLKGLTDEEVVVRTSSGKVQVRWCGREQLYLTGPAEVLFKGEFLFPTSTACELY